MARAHSYDLQKKRLWGRRSGGLGPVPTWGGFRRSEHPFNRCARAARGAGSAMGRVVVRVVEYGPARGLMARASPWLPRP